MCAAKEKEMGKNEIEFWLVPLKKIHFRAEYSGIDGRTILKRLLEDLSGEYPGKYGRKILKMRLEEYFVEI